MRQPLRLLLTCSSVVRLHVCGQTPQ